MPEISIKASSNSDNNAFQLSLSVNYSNILPHHFDFLEEQIRTIDALIKDSESGFLEFAHNRKAQILQILYYLKLNEKEESKIYRQKLLEQYEILKTYSKRMKNMYEDLISLLN